MVFRLLSVCCSCGLLMPSAIAQPQSPEALQQIEGVRGGRHWINQQAASPRSPLESLNCLQIEPGYEVELVAAEPLVQDPVQIAFDDQGRLFVIEYGDYPTGPEDGGQPLSRIILLQDTDGDGAPDQRIVFADHLHFAHSFMPWKDGLLVGAHSQILFLQDTDGDNRADVRRTLFDGFRPAHPQMQIGCPVWQIENQISLTYGPGEVAATTDPDKRSTLPGKDFIFDPLTMKFHADTTLGQYGNTVDRWGNRFCCTNRNPIIASLLPPSVLKRNPFAVIPRVQYSVGKSGTDTQVYPLVDMKSNYLSHAGTHTAACGVTAYTGGLGPADFQNSVFVCEPIGHLVTRSVVTADGPRLRARRARDRADFLASTDTWFRPSSLANGPDGALYLADMYRLWVEHPRFLPPEIAARIDWRAGDDRGRIYRITPTDTEPHAFDPNAELTAHLTSLGGWARMMGQRRLVQGQKTSVADKIRSLLRHSQVETRLHAIWTLHGLQQLTVADLVLCLGDDSSAVRRDAVRLAAEHLDNDEVQDALLGRIHDDSAQVRLQVAVSLGALSDSRAEAALIHLALRDGRNEWFRRGLLTAVADRSSVVLLGVLNESDFRSNGSPDSVQLVQQLASVCGARGNLEELDRTLNIVARRAEQPMWWHAALIRGLGIGLSRHRGSLVRTSLTGLLTDPPEQLATSTASVKKILNRTQQVCLNESADITDRLAAIALLPYQTGETAQTVLNQLLSGTQPAELQQAALQALSAGMSLSGAEIIIERWPELRPVVRSFALTLLQRRADTTMRMLQAMKAGTLSPAGLTVDQRVLLLKSSNDEIRAVAEELLGGAVSSQRQKIVREYNNALSLSGSAKSGAEVFKRVCAGCHRVEEAGHRVGPDISDVRNRSRQALLHDILDPNSKLEPRFAACIVVTVDGRTFNGLLESESSASVTLHLPEGREVTLPRTDVEEIRTSDISLMPEGVEKDITVRQMADLLEFLKAR